MGVTAMHIPDGLLNFSTAFGALSASVFYGYIAHKKLKIASRESSTQNTKYAHFNFTPEMENLENPNDWPLPLLASTAGFLFAAQMLNFPVLVGTSGHFLGSGFATALFGPYLSFFLLSIVLFIQALFFADGGLIALGANLLCMGIVAPWSFILGRFLFRSLFAGALLSVVMASLTICLMLDWSGVLPFMSTAPLMLGIHSLIGVGEGFITVSALNFLKRTQVQRHLGLQSQIEKKGQLSE